MSLRNLLLVAAIFAGLFLAPPEAFAKKRRKESKKAQREQRKKDNAQKTQLRDPLQVLEELKSSAQSSGKVSPVDKTILIEALDILARTGRGRGILAHLADKKVGRSVAGDAGIVFAVRQIGSGRVQTETFFSGRQCRKRGRPPAGDDQSDRGFGPRTHPPESDQISDVEGRRIHFRSHAHVQIP